MNSVPHIRMVIVYIFFLIFSSMPFALCSMTATAPQISTLYCKMCASFLVSGHQCRRSICGNPQCLNAWYGLAKQCEKCGTLVKKKRGPGIVEE